MTKIYWFIRESLLGHFDETSLNHVPYQQCLTYLRNASGKDYGNDIDKWVEWINREQLNEGSEGTDNDLRKG